VDILGELFTPWELPYSKIYVGNKNEKRTKRKEKNLGKETLKGEKRVCEKEKRNG
jgi:hypothetical protein